MSIIKAADEITELWTCSNLTLKWSSTIGIWHTSWILKGSSLTLKIRSWKWSCRYEMLSRTLQSAEFGGVSVVVRSSKKKVPLNCSLYEGCLERSTVSEKGRISSYFLLKWNNPNSFPLSTRPGLIVSTMTHWFLFRYQINFKWYALTRKLSKIWMSSSQKNFAKENVRNDIGVTKFSPIMLLSKNS